MGDKILINSLSYVGYILEAGLLAYLLRKGYARRLWEVVFYLVTSLGVIGTRSYTLHRYGIASSQYASAYWATDLLLVLTAFVVIASFFRRACSQNKEMWRQVRLLLVAVLVGVLGVSAFSLLHHDGEISLFFVIDFQQNLYFACLVLNTLLYLMIVKMRAADQQLGMLTCGLGIQFAGPAACLAFYYLMGGNALSNALTVFLLPLCDVGMTLTWFYAVARAPRAATVPGQAQEGGILAPGAVFHS